MEQSERAAVAMEIRGRLESGQILEMDRDEWDLGDVRDGPGAATMTVETPLGAFQVQVVKL